MGGWNIPPFMPPFLPPNVTSTASIREVRDSESERDQRTTAGRSNDSSGDDAEYIRQQGDRLQNLRGSQTTNQVPSNPQAPPIAQTPVGHRTQETSQGAYAGETRQRPREDRREQVRTTLPMHGEPAQPGPTQQALMQEQAPPGIRHSKDQSSRRDWFSGSSSSDEWGMETPVSRRSRSKGKRVVSKEQKKSERIVQVIKTFASWKISFDGEPKGRKDKAEEFLASVKEKVASTELEEATAQVAGLTVGNKPEAKAPESKPQPATTPANPANAEGGQKGKGRGRRGGKKSENGTSAGAAAETAAVTTNATKPASTSTPTPSAPPPPTPPAPQAGPWGYPWGFPPYPAPPSIGGPSRHLGAIPRAPMAERRSRERRRRVRPEPVGAEAPAQYCPAAAPLAVLAEEAEPTLDSGLDPVADSARAQQELQDWLEPRGAPTRQEVDPGQFEWPPSPPSIRRTTTPPRTIPRPIPSTTRGEAAGAAAPDEFREPALIIAPSNLPAAERRELETAVELQLRQNWDPERGWQGYLDRRDEAAQMPGCWSPSQSPCRSQCRSKCMRPSSTESARLNRAEEIRQVREIFDILLSQVSEPRS
ncbi:hypothetical protein QAD02_007527 [Eretmocerus hayati]|uniref:Uncharacterized protein n=1 Tax=Eretmocerus hayati TaxID=131215 RepID=A0ACC2N882_9HYME|nr:hypothetical protein QAD02_007527 [Eretmocerus hayati]